ncbi:zinc finger protein 687a [Betta splendens]|uniref:Zinc finger protein 687a n=1 Tax=Betta splendens TaxID=158456 RepID=A0A6P7KX94_BETSP|nr:zinc finger protein 687a [Betta splendens]
MGDMKTPDFDDLLAAFDIPDIDAKEAIQSSPEEERDEAETHANERESGSPSSFSCSPVSDSEPPMVSVIVKNAAQAESFEERDRDKTDNSSNGGSVSRVQVKLPNYLTSEHGPTMPADGSIASQIASDFEGSVPRAQEATNAKPLSHHSSLSPSLNDYESESNKGADLRENDVMHSLKPLLFPQSPDSASPISSACPSPHPVSPHLPPQSLQKEETCVLGSPLSSSLQQNGTTTTGIKHITHSDEEDSEPDLGSPLVIQESPESQMSTPLKFRHRAKPLFDRFENSDTNSSIMSTFPHLSFSMGKPKSPLEKQSGAIPSTSPSSTAPEPQSRKDCLPHVTVSASLKEEKYPEHVIDERDSPESPPPSETGLLIRNRSISPVLASTSAVVVGHNDFHQEEPMECEPSKEDKQDPSEKVAGDGECVKEENSGSTSFEESVSTSPGEIVPSPLRPLKVKIKIPTGSVTRTLTGVAPKRSAKAALKSVDSVKASPEHHNTKFKKEILQQSQLPAVAKLQDICAVKEKVGLDTKPKVSPTAVSITKTAALPPVSTPRVTPGVLNLRNLGQKTLNNGTTLPASSPPPLPQSISRPATIVNSTGAIISRNQTNLVEAFNKILNNKNLLPNYKPDLSSALPSEWGIALPAQGYRCLECGDSFALEQSLARHYDRRSLRIEVTCNHCAKRLAFFNKCSLLLHAREHKEKGLIMQCSHLVMKPVPVEQMIGQQEFTPVGQAAPNTSPRPHQASSNNKAEAVKSISSKCPECEAQFTSKEELTGHLQEVKPANTNPCAECSPPMLLPNACSAAAHQRIHQVCAPHVCPDCGATFKQSQFQKHLNETCLHFSRRIGYRCSSCLVVFGGLNSVKSHIQQAHCDMFHKCPNCPMAFKSAPSIQSHITAQHPTLTEGQTILIYKCVMCDTVFTHKPLLYAHFDTHLTNQKVHVFKCPECTKLFSQRNSLLDHFKTHKTSALKKEQPSSLAASSRSRPSVKSESSDGEGCMDDSKAVIVKTERMKTPSGWNCAPCHARYTDREDYITHMAKQHGKILKKFPCNKCESSFTTTSSMRRHIRDKHKIVNRSFRCQFCSESKKSFSSRAMLEKHVQLRHSMETVSQDTRGVGGEDADSSSEQDGSVRARQRQKGAVKMEQDEESTDGMSPVKKLRTASAPYSPPESGFRCAPCGFATETQSSFLEHISQHRRGGTEGSSLQCLECGACFTSTFSLSRHRFITHKLKETFTDNQRALGVNPASSPGSSKDHDDKNSLDDSTPASPSFQSSMAQMKEEDADTLVCKVCGKHFEKATDLNTHFRTHGMAFINARNAGKTT